ncbi:sister chromatid cohesion 1 protein 2-like isoform X2 [Magnolia sinica]|uniref:sister chromatid cohesion 1 protein 2-like isoform X2 n=1 Tax=Magnolia sinica TaxID=86752 RepID=UPI002657B624|nr:sister chromatid cohesion 1 protein 2-like isoform X2 [Magnolia sinica]
MPEKGREGGEMFYSHCLLSRKGPLGIIWIAAHCYRKLRKQQIAETDISSSVDKIMLAEVLAFRVLGFLLIGVVRIYSKKVEYLYHDCNEALIRIRDPFISGKIGLSKEAQHTSYFPITLPESFELDAFNLEGFEDGHVNHVRPNKEITLQETWADEASQHSSMEKRSYLVYMQMLYYSEETTAHHEFQPSSLTLADNIFLPDAMDIDLEISDLHNSSGLKESREKLQSTQLHLEGCLNLDMFRGTVELLDLSQCLNEPSDCIEQIKLQEVLSDIEKSHLRTEGNPLDGTPAKTPDNFPYPLVDATPEVMLVPTPSNKERNRKPRKRKRPFDGTIVLSNEALRQGLCDASSLVHVRRKAPQTILSAWKANKISNLHTSFLEPLTPGISSELKALFTRNHFDRLEPKDPAEGPTQSDEEEFETHMNLSDDNAVSPRNAFVNPSASFMSAEATATINSNEVRFELPIEREEWPATPAASNSNGARFRTPIRSEGEEPPASGTPDFWQNLMDEEISSHEVGQWNQDRWLIRTRTVAQHLHNCFSKQEEGKQKGVLSLACLLERSTRKTCARLFHETLVLRSVGYIDVKQDSPYADILLLPTPQIKAMF